MTDQQLKSAILDASRRAEVIGAVDCLYEKVQHEIDARRPVCVVSGRCCRFEEYGHRLYVTTIELASFLAKLDRVADPSWNGQGCPFQQNKLCTVHAIRPFGCRMFFCDATSTDWQNKMYEHFHAELKRLHEEHDVPYAYIEWRRALSILGVVDAAL
ncbi:MAG TPA: hypothetical protein VN541_14810 [Tepidisphaeraceae bacterium]|nr:hypothetical protein [Tepidisphaeraceae bacterium]